MGIHAHDATVAVLADREPPLRIEREPVGARLVVATDVRAGIAALRPKDRDGPVGCQPVDRVGVRRAEEEGAVTRPDRPLGELEPAGHAFCAGVRHDVVDARIAGVDVECDLLRRPGALGAVDVERR
jgi:hypothetical protein